MDKYTACSLLDFRCYLECPALEALSSSHTPQDIAQLEQIQERARKVMHSDRDSFVELLFQYHHTIIHLSGNAITPLVTNAFVPAVLYRS